MKRFLSNNRQRLAATLSVAASVLLVSGIVYATTISTNISTGGTLGVSGLSTLAGFISTASSTVVGQVNSGTLNVTDTSTFSNTVTISGAKGLVLGSSATAISGSAGMIYYDSANSVIKLNDGTSWFTVGTTTSGLTLSGNKLQLADLNYYMTIGTTSQQGLSQLTLEASSTAAIPLTLVARSGQTANLFNVVNSGGTRLLFVNSAGNLYASSTLQAGNTLLYGTLGIATTSPFSLGSNAFSVQGGAYISGNLYSVANVTATGTLAVSGLSTLSGFISTASSSVSANLNIAGPLSASSTLTVSGTSTIATAAFGVGSSTPASEISVLGVATTTMYLHSSSGTAGGCIELKSSTSTMWRIYMGSGGNATNGLVVEPGSCK